uniref:uncharacterized protein LOC120889954 n=1 Tax=Ictidomys tridecemlineatus TaxID=43179 RepID=UPI001A9F8EC4|nr:uncharacterized protein LOC120889954 [Ictidomys tridecemlineatus]
MLPGLEGAGHYCICSRCTHLASLGMQGEGPSELQVCSRCLGPPALGCSAPGDHCALQAESSRGHGVTWSWGRGAVEAMPRGLGRHWVQSHLLEEALPHVPRGHIRSLTSTGTIGLAHPHRLWGPCTLQPLWGSHRVSAGPAVWTWLHSCLSPLGHGRTLGKAAPPSCACVGTVGASQGSRTAMFLPAQAPGTPTSMVGPLLSSGTPSWSPCLPWGRPGLSSCLALPEDTALSPVTLCFGARGSWLLLGCEHTLPSVGPQAGELTGLLGGGRPGRLPQGLPGAWAPSLLPPGPSLHSVALFGWAHVPCPLCPHSPGPQPSSALWVPWQPSPWEHSGCPGTLRTCHDPEAEAHWRVRPALLRVPATVGGPAPP